ncbi:MAG: histidine ammonia-lyase [Bacteroidales bacterium]|nr:histidine ammonia-lyase [Bacteroidales bacterium]
MINHVISNELLNYDILNKIYLNPTKLSLSPESENQIINCRNYLDDKIKSSDTPIYGITTGFGSLCNVSISKNELSKLQENLVLSHACGTGNKVNDDVVRMMLLLKIHALAYGKSGVHITTVQSLMNFFNNNILPVVYEQGSLGASGDLAPLAHMVLPLLGYGLVRVDGKEMHAKEALKKFGYQPIKLDSKEGLALLNGTQFMSANGVISILQAFKLIKLADIIASISLDAYNGRLEPFFENVHTIRPHKGQLATARNIRSILDGSEIMNQEKKHVQDPYSFRCIPQVHGAVKDALNHVSKVILTEINSVTDNPTVFPAEDMIISGGNFHGEPLALAFDYLSIALSEIGSISERRVYRLISGQRNLPEFLVANPGLNSGFMIPQYTAASIVSQNKQLATPSSIDSIPSSNEQEDHVSMGANGATKLVKITENIKTVLAIELFAASQALEFRKPLKSSKYIEDFISKFRKYVPFVKNDILMHDAIANSIQFINDSEFGE